MPTPKGTYKSTIKQGSDEKGASYGNYDNGTGNLYQQNSKEKTANIIGIIMQLVNRVGMVPIMKNPKNNFAHRMVSNNHPFPLKLWIYWLIYSDIFNFILSCFKGIDNTPISSKQSAKYLPNPLLSM